MDSYELDASSAPSAVVVPGFIHPDSDGLQLADSDAAQRYPEHEGLQSVPEPEAKTIQPDATTVPAWYRKKKPTSAPGIPTVPLRPPRRRTSIVAGIIIAIVLIIIAALLGAVLGSRAAHRNASTDHSTEGGSDQSQSTRIRSVDGAFNGTGIALLATDDDNTVIAAFQDASGQILTGTFQFNSTGSSLVLESLADLQISDAANGTGISAVQYSNNQNGTIGQLFYVNKDGFYADQIQPHFPNGSWADGQLKALKVKAPTGDRPVLFATADSFDGMHNNSVGARLFAGGADGSVYQYSYDQPTDTWAPDSSYRFSEAWAYGAAAVVNHGGGNPTVYNRTLLLSDQTGSLLSYKQSNIVPSNIQWPQGYSWSSVNANHQKTAINSSITFTRQGEAHIWVVFAKAAEGIGAQQIDPEADYDEQFGDYTDNLDGLSTMQGTAFSSIAISTNFTLLLYQETGNNISYAVLDSTNTNPVTSGTVYYGSGGWWTL